MTDLGKMLVIFMIIGILALSGYWLSTPEPKRANSININGSTLHISEYHYKGHTYLIFSTKNKLAVVQVEPDKNIAGENK